MDKGLQTKYEKLKDGIRAYGSVIVAFSGGVDSTLLAYAAAEALGKENVLCVTARALSFPEREFDEAVAFCDFNDIRHRIVDFNELGVEGFSSNPPNRCYLCKRALFSLFVALCEEEGMKAVIEGTNANDEEDYRPGAKALAEFDVKSPIRETGLTKAEIRGILKMLGLPVWDKPSYACLASRFVYGEEITAEKLSMVGSAEQFLFDKGFRSIRVRLHGEAVYTARIEALPEQIEWLVQASLRNEIYRVFSELGFTYVAVDLAGYRTGSMNVALPTN